jgi:hypothetical protein
MPEAAYIALISFNLSYNTVVVDVPDHILRFLERVVYLFPAGRLKRIDIFTRKLVRHTAKYGKKPEMFNKPF